MNYLFYNPLSNGGKGELRLEEVKAKITGDIKVLDIRGFNMKDFFNSLVKEDKVYILGGDGTLNHFANDVIDVDIKNDVYLISSGTGNDFFNDQKEMIENDMIRINEHVKNLPHVYVNGMDRVFLNGIGFGIDGETARIGEEQRLKSTKPVNYAGIAVKLCLGKYKKNISKVIVDGVCYNDKDVWLASTMKGKFYGGGMMVAPNQNRFNKDNKVTFVCLHKRSRLVTLMRFTSLFKGEHIKWSDWCYTIEAKHTIVEFKYPCSLQIDGEIVENVLKYEVKA